MSRFKTIWFCIWPVMIWFLGVIFLVFTFEVFKPTLPLEERYCAMQVFPPCTQKDLKRFQEFTPAKK